MTDPSTDMQPTVILHGGPLDGNQWMPSDAEAVAGQPGEFHLSVPESVGWYFWSSDGSTGLDAHWWTIDDADDDDDDVD